MAGLNRVMLIGNVGRDVELRATQSGKPVANFSLGVSDYGDTTEWFNIVVWGDQAELANRLISKGRQLFIEGRWQTRKWTNQQGEEKINHDVVCHRFQLLGSKPGNQSDDYDELGPPLSPGD